MTAHPAPVDAASPPDALAEEAVLLSEDEAWAAALLAVDPVGLGGACLRSSPGAWRQAWLDRLQLLGGQRLRRMPAGIGETELLGGLDLSATLSSGRPVLRPGLLSQAHGGLVLLAMAERLPAQTVAHLCSAIDNRTLQLQREGLAQTLPAAVGWVALDEGLDEGEGLHPALADRLAFCLQAPQAQDETQALARAAELEWTPRWTAADIQAARQRSVDLPPAHLQALCASALALGIDSLRAPLLAARAACAAAALEGCAAVSDAHAALAARLVLAHRATRFPAAPEAPAPPAAADTADRSEAHKDEDQDENHDENPDSKAPPSAEDLQDLLIAAVQAHLDPGLLALLRAQQAAGRQRSAGGKAGAARKSLQRGRPLGALRGEPRAGARLHVLATLRAAAPWQGLRQRPGRDASLGRRIEVRREDFHVRRYRQHSATTTLFVVDASGSSALHRLAEAKGAVELLLADCYVRRDRVAVLAFRGTEAQLLLPPTRSLARAKRSLAALPGGGGTPLAAALQACHQLSRQISRSGQTPLVVLLTDGRANIALDGTPGRSKAAEDALAAARPFAADALTCLLIDTSPQAQESARQLAQAMAAHYLPLPHADAQKLSQAVRTVLPQAA